MLVDALLALAILIALLGIGNTLARSILERTRELGVLLDTIIVRSVLVTALNRDLGHRMWWPARLARKPDPAPAELRQERATALTAGRPVRLPAAGGTGAGCPGACPRQRNAPEPKVPARGRHS